MAESLKTIKEALDSHVSEYARARTGDKQYYYDLITDDIIELCHAFEKIEKNKDYFFSEGDNTIAKAIISLMYDNMKKKSILYVYLEKESFSENSSFFDYLIKAAKNEVVNQYRKNHPAISRLTGKKKKPKDPSDEYLTAYEKREKEKSNHIQFESEFAHNPDGEEYSLIDIYMSSLSAEDEFESSENKRQNEKDAMNALVSLISLFDHPGIFDGRKNNESNKEYVRLIYTEKIMAVCKETVKDPSKEEEPSKVEVQPNMEIIHKVLKNREPVIFSCADIEFTDYVYIAPCRKIEELEKEHYHKNEYFGILQSADKELKNPFPEKVYTEFLFKKREKKVSAVIISRKINEFKELLENIMTGAIA